MAFVQMQFYSGTLESTVSVNVILPEGPADRPPKVLYLLHGMNGDHTVWMRKTAVERYAGPHNLAVVMPAAQNSYYCNEAYGFRYWDYVSEELPRVMQRYFRLSGRAEDTLVAGLSMGGYGAMRLALTYPERYAAAGSFSGAVDVIRTLPDAPEARQAQWRRILGSEKPDGALDLMRLLARPAQGNRPRLYVSCGTADTLYAQHRAFVSALEAAHWDVTHAETPGVGHEWPFWDEQVRIFIENYA